PGWPCLEVVYGRFGRRSVCCAAFLAGWIAAEPRSGARPRAAPLSRALRRSAGPALRPVVMALWALSFLRMGTRLRGDHPRGGSTADLRTLPRPVDLWGAHVPLLFERRPGACHFVCHA